jgi:hypothetical protein
MIKAGIFFVIDGIIKDMSEIFKGKIKNGLSDIILD